MQARVSPAAKCRAGRFGILLCIFLLVSLVLPFLSQPVQAQSPPEISNSSLTDANVGVSYSVTLTATGGMPPYTWSIVTGVLPPGLTLNATTGVIAGVPLREALGSYTFTVAVEDTHDNMVLKQLSLTVVGFYSATITTTGLPSSCLTLVHVDGNPPTILKGGESLPLSFSLGTTHIISVSPLIFDSENQGRRFKAVEDTLTVTEANSNVVFQYAAEYFVEYKTEPPAIDGLPSPDWYPEDAMLTASATGVTDGSPGTQYHFAHWQLPTGDMITDSQLLTAVKWSGEIVAVYDTYYLLTVNSDYGTPEGAGYYKAGTSAPWSVTPAEVKMSGFFGILAGKYSAENSNGAEIMTAPQTVTILWQSSYLFPILIIVLVVLFIGLGSFLGYKKFVQINANKSEDKPDVAEEKDEPCDAKCPYCHKIPCTGLPGTPGKKHEHVFVQHPCTWTATCGTPGCGKEIHCTDHCHDPKGTHSVHLDHPCGATKVCDRCGEILQCKKICPHVEHDFPKHTPCTANKHCSYCSLVAYCSLCSGGHGDRHNWLPPLPHTCGILYHCNKCGQTVNCTAFCHGVSSKHSHDCPSPR